MSGKYYGRQRAYKTLSADIADFIQVSEKRMLALSRASIQDVINEAQLPTAKGGRMRVDTGFLRASGQASLSGMPTGPGRGDIKTKHFYDDGNGVSASVVTQLGELKFGGVFHFGWTAAYARYRELYDGFLEGALQHWPRIVAINTDTIRQRITK